jgi:hypothetical protein
MVDCATSARNSLISSATVLLACIAPLIEVSVVYSLGVNHAAMVLAASSLLVYDGKSKKQRFDQWHEDAKRMMSRKEQ